MSESIPVIEARQPDDLVAEMRALPLQPAIMKKWLWRNAASLWQLSAAVVRGDVR